MCLNGHVLIKKMSVRLWKLADKVFYMILFEILLQFYIRNLRIGQCLKTAAIMYQEMSSLQPNGN